VDGSHREPERFKVRIDDAVSDIIEKFSNVSSTIIFIQPIIIISDEIEKF